MTSFENDSASNEVLENPELEWEVYHVPEESWMDLSNTRLYQLPPQLSDFAPLKKLSLRQNFLTSLDQEILQQQELEELDLYLNQFADLDDVAAVGDTLRILDASFNDIRRLNPAMLRAMRRLERVFLIHCKLRALPDDFGVLLPETLQVLELGDNRLRSLQHANLAACPSLTELWVGRNKLESLDGVCELPSLRVLSAQSNRLTSLQLTQLPSLQELYLSHNRVQRFSAESLATCAHSLRVLDLAANHISDGLFEVLPTLRSLEQLWLNDNDISDWRILDLLAQLPNLTELYLERNPIQGQERDKYRRRVLSRLPQLVQLDALPVTPQERQRAAAVARLAS